MECTIPVPFGTNESEMIKEILASSKKIAIVGLSPDETKDSHRVAKYLQSVGYEVIPVYPKEDFILGQKVYRSLVDITGGVDIVNVFRKGDALSGIIEESAGIGARLVWGQIGCQSEEAEGVAKELCVKLVENKCLMVEHKKFFGN